MSSGFPQKQNESLTGLLERNDTELAERLKLINAPPRSWPFLQITLFWGTRRVPCWGMAATSPSVHRNVSNISAPKVSGNEFMQ